MGIVTAGRLTYDVDAFEADAAGHGWNKRELVRRAREIAKKRGARVPAVSTFYRFLSGEHQTPQIAKLIASALGRRVGRYIVVAQTAAERRAEERRARADRRAGIERRAAAAAAGVLA